MRAIIKSLIAIITGTLPSLVFFLFSFRFIDETIGSSRCTLVPHFTDIINGPPRWTSLNSSLAYFRLVSVNSTLSLAKQIDVFPKRVRKARRNFSPSQIPLLRGLIFFIVFLTNFPLCSCFFDKYSDDFFCDCNFCDVKIHEKFFSQRRIFRLSTRISGWFIFWISHPRGFFPHSYPLIAANNLPTLKPCKTIWQLKRKSIQSLLPAIKWMTPIGNFIIGGR